MTTYLTPYDRDTRQCTGPSQSLPAADLDQAAQLMGEPSSRRPAMLFYYGPPAFVISRARLSIDAPDNSGQNTSDYTNRTTDQ